METIFPTTTGYAGFFVVGFRKDPIALAQTQRIGTVILKRTYDISQDTLSPSLMPQPIFLTDQISATGNMALYFEHDLAPFKPSADIVVLGFADIAGVTQLDVNDNAWLQRDVTGSGDLFGWEARSGGTTREEQAGNFSENKDDYPPQWPVVDNRRDPLPNGIPPARFENEFFNGHLRNAAIAASAAYLPADARISIVRPDPSNNYAFDLAGESVTANYFFYRGYGPDRDDCWKRTSIEMNLDTLVIEPERDRCYVVWRGVWNYDDHREDSYRRLIVTE